MPEPFSSMEVVVYWSRLAIPAFLVLFVSSGADAQSGVVLWASEESPAPVGTLLTFEAIPPGSGGDYRYRFSIRNPGEDFHVVRDFSKLRTLNWAALDEGEYIIAVTVRDEASGESEVVSGAFELRSRLSSAEPAVSHTHHPLVVLYSAPPCPAGSEVRVEFKPKQTEGRATLTPPRPCREGASVNFWLAGLRAGASYTARHFVDDQPASAPVRFETSGEIPSRFFPQTASGGPTLETSYPLMLHSPLAEPPSATDLEGNLVWYYPGNLTSLTRLEDGGRVWGFVQDLSGPPERQVIREFDLAGITLRETDAGEVNRQLEARGLRPITGFHHEVRSLPGGKVLALASSEHVFTDVQGEGEVDVIGDTIIVLDSNLQVEWVWDSFDHLDVSRLSTLPHVCNGTTAGCPPYWLKPVANDWTHGNAVALTPDGNLLFSMRHMDWLIKIDYDNGNGSGNVIWRLGREGDFTPVSDDPNPWFSHQHDGVILEDGRLLVFDNGNFRFEDDKSVRSRGQVWRLDEAARTARLEVNADLGAYAFALGSAQALESGYHWGVGIVGMTAMGVETNAGGGVVYWLGTPSPVYRSYRLKDMYTKP